MYRTYFLSILCTILTLFFATLQVKAETESEKEVKKMHEIFDENWEYYLERYPTSATYEGDHRFDDKLPDFSEKAILKDRERTKEILKRIKGINYDILPKGEKLNLLLYKNGLESQIEGFKFNSHLMPIGQQNGFHISFPQIQGYSRFESVKDYENYISRLNGYSQQIDNLIERMQKGVEQKIVPPQKIMEKVVPQIKALIKDNPKESILFKPASKFPESFSDAEKQELSEKMASAISQKINPANQKLLEFFEKDYLPNCRENFGTWSLPNGNERYAYLAKSYTTTDLTPEEIAELGRKELKRIRAEMETVKQKVSFEGSLDEFITYVREDKQFYATSGEQLMEGFREILNKMDKELPKFFKRLPKSEYDLKEIEEFRALSAPVAYYYSAPEDRSRPGYFYVNTSLPEKRALYTMEALAFHEAVPGHHLQIAFTQELKNLPKFRQGGGETAFVEGWGLYAESLGKEAGFYQDPYSDYGRLTFEAWRAVRLIVDTGMHYFKWTREDAIEFCLKNLSLAEVDIESEVERYISTPGQALAYKIGELKIKEIRAKATKELGDKFDIREFHDALLRNGGLPLSVLEKIMDEWIEQEKMK